MKTNRYILSARKLCQKLIYVFFVMALFAPVESVAFEKKINTDSLLTTKQIAILSPELNYPIAVKRFYREKGFKRVWVFSDTVKSSVYQAMMLLDCVLQFGLNHQDFHPSELTYDKLKPLLTTPWISYGMDREVFDIYMTDAMITMINHLHYGKFNPVKTTYVIERSQQNFAIDLLSLSLNKKDFMGVITQAEPNLKSYNDLQQYLRLVKGQYVDDCYEFPEGEARKMVINMERMRWLENTENYFLRINIPAFSLTLNDKDTITSFKVIVGKPTTPTPQLESKVKYLTTAPEWRVPAKIFARELLPKAIRDTLFLENNHYAIYDLKGNYITPTIKNLKAVKAKSSAYLMTQSAGCDNALGRIVFRFPNRFDIYLHDTPEQQLFSKEQRAFSHGCIRLEEPEKLAYLLFNHDGDQLKSAVIKQSIKKMEKRNFYLKRGIPIQITYFTAEMTDGILKVYPDLYHLDARLEQVMFPSQSKWAKDR